jgi:hypothetical protein
VIEEAKVAAPYPTNVPYIQDGEPVSAGVAGRPDRVLATRDQYLKDRLDAAELGEAIVAHGATLAAGVLIGQPVYWNAVNQQFEPGLAAVAEDPESGVFSIAPSCDVVGVVQDKFDPTCGDVVLSGRVLLDLTNSAGPNALAGRYYLSSSVPGQLTLQRPPIYVPVLYYDGQGTAYVNPTTRDALGDHVHYRFQLFCVPAGTHSDPGFGNRHQIINPDPTLPGWLPADHPIFEGHAPTGAVWGYNLAEHPALLRVFPPVPVNSAVLFWDEGSVDVRGTLVPLGDGGLAQIDNYGIWWLSDCYEDIPWPRDYDSANPPPPVTTTVPPTCPRVAEMELTLAFTVMLFATDTTMVTSLQPAPGSPITVTNCVGAPARTGDLELDLDLAFLTDDENIAGARVFKQLEGLTFKAGFVVEALVPGSNVTLTPTAGTAAAAQGTVTIDVDTDLAERELAPQIVRLDDTKERFLEDVPYIGFPSGRQSAVRLRFNVPAMGTPANPQVTLRLLLLGTAAGTLPPLVVTARQLPRPAGATSVVLPTVDFPVTINTNVAVGAVEYLEIEATPFAVNPGDTLLVTVQRNWPDGYSNEVGMIRSGAIIGSGGSP